VNSLLISHDEDIENKISYFVDRITERVGNSSKILVFYNKYYILFIYF